MNDLSAPPAHAWKFFRAGGFDQVRLDTGADLLSLRALDQKLWVALSCPVSGTEFDPATLAALDSDHDGHVRSPELLAAIDWLAIRLRDRELLARGTTPLPLAAIDDSTSEGQRALSSARRILANLGRPDADVISVDEAEDHKAIFGGSGFNGDGIITTLSTSDEVLKALIAEIGNAYGTRIDRSGEAGIDQPAIDRFVADANALLAWQVAGEPVALSELDDPAGAHAAFAAIRERVDDYFSRCRLAAYDERAATLLNGADADFQAFARDSLAQPGAAVAALPLARIEARRPLPLGDGLNPAWSAAVAEFVRSVVTPLLGRRESLSDGEWCSLCARLSAYSGWQAGRPAVPAAVASADLPAALAAATSLGELVTQDLELAEDAAAVDEVARLTRLVRDLGRFANNFVSFRDFYTHTGKATFQAGTLYMDGRSCDLCIRVTDPAKHAALASLSRIYLAYCDCVRGDEKMTIAVAFTAGDTDQLMIGRNGVFYDRQGRDWDATIVRIVDNPISLRQAFWSPYKKLARLIGDLMQKFAAARAQSSDSRLATSVADGPPKIETGKPATPSAFDVGKFAGIFAAIGLAIGAIGTVIAALVGGFFALKWWQMPIAIGGIMLLISAPAVLLAFLKLRSRTLGPLLDATGWAVNARARINIPFGTTLTQLARLPAGAERALSDPYAEKPTPWGSYLLIVALIVGVWYLSRNFLT